MHGYAIEKRNDDPEKDEPQALREEKRIINVEKQALNKYKYKSVAHTQILSNNFSTNVAMGSMIVVIVNTDQRVSRPWLGNNHGY